MEKQYNMKECPLHGTRECRLLNMAGCESCPMVRDEGETAKDLSLAVNTFERLLPEGGIARLFEMENCCFCKGENQNRKSGYAIFSMAHPEPQHEKTVLVKKWKMLSPVGTLVPMQVAICGSCRRRLLLLEYLPTVATILATGLSLLCLMGEIGTHLTIVAGWLPFLVWVIVSCIGYSVGRLLKHLLAKRFSEIMFVDFTENYVIRGMIQKGWFTLPKGKTISYVFSRKRSENGLGTAPSSAYKGNEGAEE